VVRGSVYGSVALSSVEPLHLELREKTNLLGVHI
jgi:hypothetical protein